MSRDRLALEGPEGTLEAVLEGETENPAMIAIVCHPHPQFGGTMDN
ncbi:MAG TPA: alpha/beta hydrolase, partial [Alcanivorax sp.]|nr:alpha/beta hydrolase [Alcanivorax sp.]